MLTVFLRAKWHFSSKLALVCLQGLEVNGDVGGVNVLGCLFSSIAAHGILVNGVQQPAPGRTPHDLRFSGSVFERAGALFAGASAIAITGGSFGTIARNRFTDLPRNAIGLVSSFREPMVLTTNWVIRENVIKDTCRETDDTGAIVIYAQQRDNRHSNASFVDGAILIERNNITQTVDRNSMDGVSVCTHGRADSPGHEATCRNHTWGVYCDGVSSGVNISSNVISAGMQGGIYFHQGGSNTAINNIIVDGQMYLLCLGTPDQVGSKLTRNLFVWREPTARVLFDFNVLPRHSVPGTVLPALVSSDYNLYYCTGLSVSDVLRNVSLFPLGGSRGLEGWQSVANYDKHSIVADPLFVRPERGDYSLRAESPALSQLHCPRPPGAVKRP